MNAQNRLRKRHDSFAGLALKSSKHMTRMAREPKSEFEVKNAHCALCIAEASPPHNLHILVYGKFEKAVLKCADLTIC